MILAIIFAQVWGVIQLIVLTSLSRTVRVRTVFAAMGVGFYAIGPVTAFIQLSWIRIAAHVFGKAVFDLTGVASYTVDPFIEEAMKLVPLLVLFLIPAIRRQWSVTDCLLIAAATGSGFGLAEHLFRYADYANTAQSMGDGYMMTIGSATPLVPGILRTLTSWIPLGVFFESTPVHINWHLAWCAITGLAVGLFLRNPKQWARPTAVGLIVLVCLNHAAGNAASVQYTWLSSIAAPMRFLDSLLAFLVLVAVAAAWWIDQPTQRAGMALGPLLAAEQSATSRLAGTVTAAVSRIPWSIPWVLGFDRSRRAYHAARASSPGTVDDMRNVMVAERDSVHRKLTQAEAPPLLPPALMPKNLVTTLGSALRRPPVILWLVLIAPSILYLIIGGFPALSGLQTVMKGPIVWPLVLLITLANQGRKVWRVITGIRKLPAAVRHPMGDDAAMITLAAASGLGTLSLAGFTFARVLSGVGAGERMLSTAHAADAINRTQPAGGAAVAGSGGAFDPPPPSPVLPGDAAPAEPSAAPAAGAGAASGGAPGGSAPGAGAPSDSPGSAEPGYPEAGAAQPATGVAASSIGGAFDPPPASPELPDRQSAAPEDPTAEDSAPADASQLDTSKRLEAGYENKDHYDYPTDDERAADGEPPTGASAAQPSSGGGGAFDPPPPSAQLPDAPREPAPVESSADQSARVAAQEGEAAREQATAVDGSAAEQADSEEGGVGTRVPDEPPPAPRAPSLQDQADKALARSEQADEDAVAAEKARDEAWAAAKHDLPDDEGNPTPNMTAFGHSVDAQNAAEANAADAHEKAIDAAEAAKAQRDPAGAASDAAQRQGDKALAESEQADEDAVAAQKAQEDAWALAKHQLPDADGNPTPDMVGYGHAVDATNAAQTHAADAHEKAVDAANAAKAATDPLGAAADAAQRDLANAQKAENDAFFHKDAEAYREARAALDVARQKAADAQAAADAAKNSGGSDSISSRRKP